MGFRWVWMGYSDYVVEWVRQGTGTWVWNRMGCAEGVYEVGWVVQEKAWVGWWTLTVR